MHRYQIKQGYEHVTFGGDGVRNLGDGTVESDVELNSPLLTIVSESDQMTTAPQLAAPAAPQLAAPVAAPARISPPLPETTPIEGDAK